LLGGFGGQNPRPRDHLTGHDVLVVGDWDRSDDGIPPPMNAVYQSCFASGRLPARACIGVTAIARGALVEIDLLARRTPA